MPTTAHELNGNLVIDFGDGSEYTIYPVPGRIGIEMQALLVGISLGVTAHEHGPERLMADTERLTKLSLGVPTEQPAKQTTKRRRKAPNAGEQAALRRYTEFDQMRAARQTLVSQIAILWNTGGGGIEAVLDLINEDGGYPKALGRVMQSSGLGAQYEVLRTWLSGAASTSETASMPNPTGGPSTSA